jgi:hypothetical protein
MTIIENIISSYLDFHYKSYLKLTTQNGETHLVHESYDNDIFECTDRFKEFLINNKKSIFVFGNDPNPLEIIKSKPYYYFFNARLIIGEHQITSS